MLYSKANVIMVSSGANVIIWCYHVMLSSGMITPLFLFFLKTSLTRRKVGRAECSEGRKLGRKKAVREESSEGRKLGGKKTGREKLGGKKAGREESGEGRRL